MMCDHTKTVLLIIHLEYIINKIKPLHLHSKQSELNMPIFYAFYGTIAICRFWVSGGDPFAKSTDISIIRNNDNMTSFIDINVH